MRPEQSENAEWSELDALVDECLVVREPCGEGGCDDAGRRAMPLIQYLSDHGGDPRWCAAAMEHLMGGTGTSCSYLDGARLQCLAMLCDRRRPQDAERVVEFARTMLTGIAKQWAGPKAEREPTPEEGYDPLSCLHMTLSVLSATPSTRARELLEEIVRDNRATEIGGVACAHLECWSKAFGKGCCRWAPTDPTTQ